MAARRARRPRSPDMSPSSPRSFRTSYENRATRPVAVKRLAPSAATFRMRDATGRGGWLSNVGGFHMKRAATGAIALLLSASFVALPGVATPAGAQVAPGGGTRAIPAAGTTSIRNLPLGAEGLQQPELRQGRPEEEGGTPVESDMVATTQRGEAGQFNRENPAMKGGSPFPKKPLDP